MRNAVRTVFLGAFMVVVLIGVSLAADALLMTPNPEGLTRRLVVKSVGFVLAFQVAAAVQHWVRGGT
jgi:hypothetical protein